MNPQEWIEKVAEYEDAAAQTRGIFLGQTVRFAREGAQHLAAALAEIARLKAQLSQAERVVVPESVRSAGQKLSNIAFNMKQMDAHANWKNTLDEAQKEWDLAIRSVPASRVLKEGEVAVTRAELAPLRIIANHFSRGDREWILEYTVPVEMALDALDALRSQEGGAR